MKAAKQFPAIYLYKPHVDMRKSFNGLCQLVETGLSMTPCQDALFVFISRDRTILKALYWDRTGFAIWHKRLEREKFHWLRQAQGPCLAISSEELDWLLAGLDIERGKPHEELSFSAFS